MTNHSTHIIRNYTAKKTSTLHRVSDGVVIAVRQERKIAWGEDPAQQQGRVFADEQYAQRFLRRVADLDQAMRKGHVCKDCGFAPAEVIECAINEDKAHRVDHSLVARVEEVDGEPRIKVVQ